MESHELEIEIGPDSKVRLRTSGVKGPSCLEYAKLVEALVGKIQSTELTAEYYEPDSKVTIDSPIRQKQRRK